MSRTVEVDREAWARILDPIARAEAERLMALTWNGRPAPASTERIQEVLAPSLTKADQLIALAQQVKP